MPLVHGAEALNSNATATRPSLDFPSSLQDRIKNLVATNNGFVLFRYAKASPSSCLPLTIASTRLVLALRFSQRFFDDQHTRSEHSPSSFDVPRRLGGVFSGKVYTSSPSKNLAGTRRATPRSTQVVGWLVMISLMRRPGY